LKSITQVNLYARPKNLPRLQDLHVVALFELAYDPAPHSLLLLLLLLLLPSPLLPMPLALPLHKP
jgi:hypothetical protein